MAKIVRGLGTSHTPMISEPPEFWLRHGEGDKRSRELISPRSFSVVPYNELEAEAGDQFEPQLTLENFTTQYNQLQRGVAEVTKALKEANPDVLIIVTDDQDEIMFDDNMPAFYIYWGEKMKLLAREIPDTAPEFIKAAMWGYGDVTMDVPVDAELGQHLIEYLTESDFDIAHGRYLNDEYGGSIGPAGYVHWKRETKKRPHGMPHGLSYVIRRVFDNNPYIPIVPVIQNTCYPPNQPTPRRCYALGKAIRSAVEAYGKDKRVAIMGSGGLSHFVLDEETDRMAIRAMETKDAEALCNLPKERLNSASSEIRNWITTAGACEHLDFELFEYVPVARTPAGSGGGWGFSKWE